MFMSLSLVSEHQDLEDLMIVQIVKSKPAKKKQTMENLKIQILKYQMQALEQKVSAWESRDASSQSSNASQVESQIKRLKELIMKMHKKSREELNHRIDGVGLGLITQHYSLGKVFDLWCLHIPVKDRTSFTGLVKLVERTVRSENHRSPNRPIYLVGESLGACLALAVAARNPDVDLLLILANPGTSFNKSQLEPLIPLWALIPDPLQLRLPYILSLMTGDPFKVTMDDVTEGVPLQQTVGEFSQHVAAIPSYLSVLGDVLPRETLLWKLQLLKSASAFANSRLHAVKAQTLILSSGRDHLLPSAEEAQRLHSLLPKCETRLFSDSGHFLFLQEDVDLVTTIVGASFYRRGAYYDYISDYIQPSPYKFKKIYESTRWLRLATSPVMLSTFEDGKIVRGLAGLPSEGPVLKPFAQASVFKGSRALVPRGTREAFHRKGEEYKLFWPEKSEFVRMAAKFGAKIVPFGVIGEDDFLEVVFDYDDQMKIPLLRDYIIALSEQYTKVRNEENGEVGKQDIHLPGLLPKFPGRFIIILGNQSKHKAGTGP
ncbi:hypothetical protein GH714_029750 [Hevea brasiliensis]|uniref:AB hydrolase-1 domain-containing protein n=1 Tax=Hevea brasiliensis TaxID=3981 RepID=A0A6A6LMU4_HEVBR|nr:hypothetical protein GH714_029750 [Hevea brasiliensis]